jgi:diguanylate cyclase (GGDEF)-like protein/PAS domain S-box-containing protein
MLGYRRAELLGESFLKFTFDADVDLTIEMQQRMKNSLVDRVRFVKRYAHKGGHSVVAEVAVSAARDAAGAILYFIVSLRDITAERELTTRLEFQALHDPLTGLANRTLFADRFAAALERAKRTAGTGAVIMLDLDGFKEVNDTYGHLVGDDLLRQAAHRMSGAARGADTLCRFGGDEFLYLAENLTGPDDAALVADRLRCTFDAPFVVGSRELHVNVSVGLSCWDQFSTNQDVVVNAADNALYNVKLQGKERQVLVTT